MPPFTVPSSKPAADPLLLDEHRFRALLYRASSALTAALALPGLALLVLIFFLLRSAEFVDHTDRVIAEAQQVRLVLLTLQTNFRGYRLSGETSYAEQIEAGRAELPGRLNRLVEMTADNAGQRERAGQLAAESERWLAYVAEEMERVRSGAAQLQDPAFLVRGAPLFATTLSRAEAFVAEEGRLRDSRAKTLGRVIGALFAALALAMLVGIPLLAFWLLRLLRRVSHSYELSLQTANRRAAELRVTLSSIGDAVIATDAASRVEFVNAAAEALTGWSAADAQGRDLNEVFPIFNEQTGQVASNPVERVLRENRVVGLANHTVLRSRSGRERPIEDSAAPIRNESGEAVGVILVFHDVSEKRESQRRLEASEHRFRFLNELGDATRAHANPQEIMTTSARLLGEHLRVSRCAYADVAPDGEQFRIQHDYTVDCASTVGDYHLSLFGPLAVQQMRGGKTLLVRDVDAELAPDEGAAMFNAIQVKAIICCPLVKEGALKAMMAVHQTTPRQWTEAEVALVEEVVERCWATIERARVEAEAHERAGLSALRAEIVEQFHFGETLERTLQSCCELVRRHLDAELVGIWVLPPGEGMLQLSAAAGENLRNNEAAARIPLSESGMRRVVETREPFLTNDFARIAGADAWPLSETAPVTAFAGYPLLIESEVLGVLAVFSRKALSSPVQTDLGTIADAIAQHKRRKRAEAALLLATNQARAGAVAAAESAERFRLLAEVVSLQVWTANLQGELDFANQQCVVYLGGDLERDILGNAWARAVHPDDLSETHRRWQHSLSSGERYEVEFRLRGKDGEYRWFLARAEAMHDAEGRRVKWFGTNTDIHALKLAQSDAERASRAKDAFLATLSHELRTPLTPVLMAAAALREDARLPADVREQLGMMERNIGLEARLIDDLLDLTSIARGKLHLRAQPCDAHSLIGLALEIVRDDASSKGIALEREFAADRSGLVADPARFQQVIWNLLRNAVKFTPRGGRIIIRTKDDAGDRLRIEISDSGIGIAPAELDKIFMPFEQGAASGDHRFGGMGLGLAIARAIVDLHGGTISAESEGKGQGATFIVELPGAIDPPHGFAENSHDLSGANAGSDVPANAVLSRRLLLVEDHEPTLHVLSRLLIRAGHQVVTAGNVADALAAADAHRFDLVVSDLGLPDGTGIELMEKLRAKHGLRGIALSGYGMEEDLVRSREAGFITHLIKPVDFHQLTRAFALID
ncbi:MAG TPA: PAS domain S-box protein [Chthoniobacteraceae bacterium]|jgi:PAS domain S-box-containing protein